MMVKVDKNTKYILAFVDNDLGGEYMVYWNYKEGKQYYYKMYIDSILYDALLTLIGCKCKEHNIDITFFILNFQTITEYKN